MFNRYKKLLLVPLFGVLLTSNAFATTANTDSGVIPPNVLTGINGLINVSEQPCGNLNMVTCNNAPFESGIQYSLSILDSSPTLSISAFAISTNTMAYSGDVWTNRTGWSGVQYSQTSWNSNFSSVGLFSSLFGGDTYVNYFSQDLNQMPDPITVSSDAIFEFYHTQGVELSNFIALDNNGIVDRSLGANSVPEPAPLALLGFGLLGIGLLRGRRKS